MLRVARLAGALQKKFKTLQEIGTLRHESYGTKCAAIDYVIFLSFNCVKCHIRYTDWTGAAVRALKTN